MQDSTPPLHGHVVRNTSYVPLKGRTRNKTSVEKYFPFIRKTFSRLNYHGQKKSRPFPREMLPAAITGIQPSLSAGRYVLSALIIGSLSPWL